jgi:pyruvate/2-oxoglutarate dehydrogenase complex dihydrolipoamide acyltransferase (E2) component
MILSEILAIQPNANDEEVTVNEWLVSDGDRVEEGQPILVIETSKITVEMEAESAGFVRIAVEAGGEVDVGTLLGWIVSDADERPEAPDSSAATRVSPEAEAAPSATAKARRIAEEHDIDLSTVESRGIITERHVQAAIDVRGTEPESRGVALSRVQQAAMKAVVRAHAEQAPAAILGEADVTESLRQLEVLSEQAGVAFTFSIADLVIHQVARELASFPLFNSTLDGVTVLQHDEVNVGSTAEVKGQLHVVVVRGADDLGLREIALARMDALMQLMRGKPLHSGAAGTFTVTVLDEPSTIHQIPIVFPKQGGILGVGGVREEFRPDAEGRPVLRRIMGLTVAYDHRFIYGAYASKFLQAVATRLQSPEMGS